MRKLGVIAVVLLAGAWARADERGAPGPNEDGTAPALVRVAVHTDGATKRPVN